MAEVFDRTLKSSLNNCTSAFVPSCRSKFSRDTAIFYAKKDIFHIRAINIQVSPKLHTLYAGRFAAIGP